MFDNGLLTGKNLSAYDHSAYRISVVLLFYSHGHSFDRKIFSFVSSLLGIILGRVYKDLVGCDSR